MAPPLASAVLSINDASRAVNLDTPRRYTAPPHSRAASLRKSAPTTRAWLSTKASAPPESAVLYSVERPCSSM
eukprot:2276645-Rhodomonas_salina.2